MKTIQFTDIGRNKRSFVKHVAVPDLDDIADAAKAHGGLMSSNVWASEDEQNPGTGFIHAGMYTVGRFAITDIADTTP